MIRRYWPLIFASLVSGGFLIWYQLWRSKWTAHTHPPYTTTTPHYTTIRQIINTIGTLRVKDSSRIGSLVSGTVQRILVAENEPVTEGQLLAVLDNGKKDTAIRHAQGRLTRAIAYADYYANIYAREKELFTKGHTSAQEFEEHTRNMLAAKGEKETAQAELDAAKIEYSNTFIRAPEDGVVIHVGIKKGFKVTTDLNATVLFEIAKDITKMEAEIDIDESDINNVRPGQTVTFTVDCFPNKEFKAHIATISFSPAQSGSTTIYNAILDIDNSALLLRPGMTIHTHIKVAKAKNTLAVTTRAFYLEENTIKALAYKLGYKCKTLSTEEKKQISRQYKDTDVRYIWLLHDKTFIERAITVAAHDDQCFEVREGLSEKELYLIDIVEENKMNELYKSMVGGSLS